MPGVVDTIDAVGLCGLLALPTATAGSAGATTPTLGNGVNGTLPETTTVTRSRPVARFRTRLVGNPSVIDLTLSWANTARNKRAKKPKLDLRPLVVGRTTVPVAKVRKALRGRTVRYRGLSIRGSGGATYATLRVSGVRAATAGTGSAHAAGKVDWNSWGGKRK